MSIQDQTAKLGVKSDLQAVVLAAGSGTRVMPLTRTTPKALLPIANRPLLDYVISALQCAGLNKIVVVTGHMGWKIVRYLETSGRHSTAEIKCVQADKYKYGPLYSLLAAEELIDDDFLLTPADLILAHEIVVKLLKSYVERNTIYVAIDQTNSRANGGFVSCCGALRDNSDPELRFGPVVRGRGNGNKKRIILGASIGIVICPVEIFGYARTESRNGSTKVVDALNRFINEGGKGRHVKVGVGDYWFDVDTIETMLAANRFILEKSLIQGKSRGKLYPDRTTLGPEDGVSNFSRSPTEIIGPVIIGKRCTIREGSRIGPHVSIQENCIIGSHVTCKNAIILRKSKISDNMAIEDAVIHNLEIISAKKHNNEATDRDGKNG